MDTAAVAPTGPYSPLRATTTPSWPRYAGTTGRTQGDRNEMSPANSATPSVRSMGRASGEARQRRVEERTQLPDAGHER